MITVKNFPDEIVLGNLVIMRFSVHLCQRKFLNKHLRFSHHVFHVLFIPPLVSKSYVPCFCHVRIFPVLLKYSEFTTQLHVSYTYSPVRHPWSPRSLSSHSSRTHTNRTCPVWPTLLSPTELRTDLWEGPVVEGTKVVKNSVPIPPGRWVNRKRKIKDPNSSSDLY